MVASSYDKVHTAVMRLSLLMSFKEPFLRPGWFNILTEHLDPDRKGTGVGAPTSGGDFRFPYCTILIDFRLLQHPRFREWVTVDNLQQTGSSYIHPRQGSYISATSFFH